MNLKDKWVYLSKQPEFHQYTQFSTADRKKVIRGSTVIMTLCIDSDICTKLARRLAKL